MPEVPGADCDVFEAAAAEDVAEGGLQQYQVVGGNFSENGLEGADGAVGVEFGDDQHVAGQAVGPGVMSGDDAGDVCAGYCGEDGVVVAAGHTIRCEGVQVGHQVLGDLRRLEAVEDDD